MTIEKMTQEVKARTRELAPLILTPAKKTVNHETSYKCPKCGHGKGGDGLCYDPNSQGNALHCFGSCSRDYSIIDLQAITDGKDPDNLTAEEFVETVKTLGKMIGLEADELTDNFKTGTFKGAQRTSDKTNEPEPKTVEKMIIDPPERKPNTLYKYKEFVLEAAENLDGAAEYLTGRGISLEVCKKYKLGYNPKQKFYDKDEGAWIEAPGVIFPYNAGYSYFSARSLEGKHFYKPGSKEAGEEPLYNPIALESGRPCFVVEGALDALAIITAGGEACALIGTAGEKLVNYIKVNGHPDAPLILSLDNDKPGKDGKRPGKEAQKRLAESLEELGVEYIEAAYTLDRYTGDKKDANDLIRANPEQLASDVKANEERATDKTGLADLLFWTQTKRYQPIKTGIAAVDSDLKGGLIPQTLNMISAAPGAGKTILACMIAENLAAAGRRVVYLNFEMPREQLLARSLSRRIYEYDNKYHLTATDILQGYKLSEQQNQLLARAANSYRQETGGRLTYNPAGMNTNLNSVLKLIDGAGIDAARRGEPGPVVFVDYLHLLTGEPGEDVAATIQRALQTLKKYAIEYDTIVFAISAQSREANKSKHSSQTAARDTSNIEYGADLILQLYTPDGAKGGEVALAITKSRFSATDMEGKRYIRRGDVSTLETFKGRY